jgi:hypothetical protein
VSRPHVCLLPDGTPAVLLWTPGVAVPEVLPLFGGSLVYLPREPKDHLHVGQMSSEEELFPGGRIAGGNTGRDCVEHHRVTLAAHTHDLVQFLLKRAALTFHAAKSFRLSHRGRL